jgi:hypothetical protein
VRTLLEEQAYDALYVGRILRFLGSALDMDRAVTREGHGAPVSAVEVKQVFAESARPGTDDSDTRPLKPSDVVNFLGTRLGVFLSWLKVYGNRRVECTEQLATLAFSYRSVLKKRLTLLKAQTKACQDIDNLINRINVHGRTTEVHTPRADELAEDDKRTVKDLEDPRRTYGQLMEIKVRDSANEAREFAERYDRSINKMLRELEHLAGDEEAQKTFVFHPISIRFLLKNRFMDFYKLSFGQKCGLILNIVLSVSKAKVFLVSARGPSGCSGYQRYASPDAFELGCERAGNRFSDEIVGSLDIAGVEYTVSVPFERFIDLKARIEARCFWWRGAAAEWSYLEAKWKPKAWKTPHRFS